MVRLPWEFPCKCFGHLSSLAPNGIWRTQTISISREFSISDLMMRRYVLRINKARANDDEKENGN